MNDRPHDYDIVVSAENNHYTAWQAMLFHYSCLKQLGRTPIVVVHGDSRPLLPAFSMIREHGGRVQRARNFREYKGLDYPPRNTAGTLQCVKSDAEYLVVCDPDMIFLRPVPFERYRLRPDEVSFDAVGYLKVNRHNRSSIKVACARAGLDLKPIERSPINGGVPNIIPRRLQRSLSEEWLRCTEFFVEEERSVLGYQVRTTSWLSIMWALEFAVRRMGLRYRVTHFSVPNPPGTPAPRNSTPRGPFIVHYCQGDSIFDKRRYFGPRERCERVWLLRAKQGSISSVIRAEIRAARQFYGIPSRRDR